MNDFEQYAARLEYLFRRALNRLGQAMSHVLGDDGITSPQFVMMRLIKEREAVTVSELSEMMGVTPSAITLVCDRLVSGGWLERERSEQDRRQVFIKMTPDGKTRLIEMERRQEAVLRRYLTQLTHEEQTQLLALYERLVEIVETTPPEEAPE